MSNQPKDDGKNREPVKPMLEPAAPPKKETSGDKHFDDAIDKIFKKSVLVAPSK